MLISAARYLTSFHPKEVPHFFTDILVVDSGLAGLRAVLGVDRNLSVLVVTKGELQLSTSAYAQGGIAAVLGTHDRFEDHAADTLNGWEQFPHPYSYGLKEDSSLRIGTNAIVYAVTH